MYDGKNDCNIPMVIYSESQSPQVYFKLFELFGALCFCEGAIVISRDYILPRKAYEIISSHHRDEDNGENDDDEERSILEVRN